MSAHEPTSSRPTATRPYRQPRNAWQIVAVREVLVKLVDKSFIGGTILTLVLIAGGVGFGAWQGSRATTVEIAVVDQQATRVVAAIDQTLRAQNAKSSAAAVSVSSLDQARAALRDGQVEAALVATEQGWRLVFDDAANDQVRLATSQAVQTLVLADLAQQAGVSVEELTQRATVGVELLQGDSAKADLGRAAGFAFAVLFFMSALTFGMQIAQSVVEEKSSRVVEILVSAIPVRQLLAGKVVGNTVLAFAQMALYALVSIIGITFTPWKRYLPSIQAPMAWFLVFFVAGFLALACIWAAAGSMASRSEDVNSTTTPLTMGLTLIYVLGFTATGWFQTAMSYVPVVSSVLMPARILSGDTAWWEPVIALVLNVAFAVLTVRVGERIYRRSLLQTSGKLSYRQAFTLTD